MLMGGAYNNVTSFINSKIPDEINKNKPKLCKGALIKGKL
jgi:hypothetical protein